jgi:hypothetical protein
MGKRVAVIAASLAAALAAAGSMAAPAALADPPPFGQPPVMGYNTWYQFGAGATESAVLRQADYLVSSGLAAAGYDTVNLDDGWMASSRTSDGSLTWDTTKFPDGIPWLASQIHALGLKSGIYEAIGTRTRQNLPGSGGTTASDNYYAQDARTFADWGVDFVKIDECGGLPSGTTLSSLTTAFEQYARICVRTTPTSSTARSCPFTCWGSLASRRPSSHPPPPPACGGWQPTSRPLTPRQTRSSAISPRTCTCMPSPAPATGTT